MKKRMNTKKLVYIGLLAAVATALMYLELPLTTGTVKIWFEDEKSLKAKAGLVQTYGLGGAAFWRKGFEPAHFWQRFAKHELT